jgi:hypothetical protein
LEGFFMRSFEQMGQSAYERFAKEVEQAVRLERDAVWGQGMPTWDHLHAKEQVCWVEVAKHVAAEVAALH